MRQFLRAVPFMAAVTALFVISLPGCAADRAPQQRTLVPVLNFVATGAMPANSSHIIRAVSAAPQPAPELRVMTFNVRVKTFLDMFGNSWDSRRDLLVSAVRSFDPDVLGTQECLAEQADYLRSQLSEYSFVGVGRDDGNRHGEMVGVFYKTEKFERIDSGNFWLSTRPDVPGTRSWGSSFTRMVTWIKLRPRDGGESFCLFNTHFDVFGGHARLESARLLRAEIEKIAPQMPCIVTGDFNDTPGSAPYRTLLAGATSRGSLVDVFRATHPIPTKTEGTRHEFSGSNSGPRIDWIMTNAGFQPIESAIGHTHDGSKFPSDHFPVMAVLRPIPATPAPAAFPGVARIE